MHTNTLEETAVPDTPNEPQPDISEPASTTQPETPEPETAALVPTPIEQEVIEGEVIVLDPPNISEDHAPARQKPYWLLIPLTICVCLIFLGVSLLVPLLTPSATITIIPVETNISLTTAIQVPGRQLPPLTLMQSTTAPATGTHHQSARHAAGTITFYNGLLTSQTILAGTMFTGNDGVQIITDQAAIIPAGNPPSYGQITVSAHAVLAGERGNIPAYDINTACCATSVVAKNTQAFTGGERARDFLVVSRTDINNAVTSLLVPLGQSDIAALQAQLRPGEALITPTCTPHVVSDHKPGDEAKQVSVTVSETCAGIAYDAHMLRQNATQLVTTDVTTKLKAPYALIGDIQITIVHAEMIHTRQAGAQIIVQVTGTWVYQISPDLQHHFLHLIAGKPKATAIHILLSQPGIQRVQITVRGGNQTLPDDPRSIHIILVYRGI